MLIPMAPPNPQWADQFAHISSQLAVDMSAAGATFTSILHIGSTSIPNLNAKPQIDILITIPPEDFYDTPRICTLFCNALRDGEQQGGYHYIGNGGLRERWSFKLGIRDDLDGCPVMPHRNVYIVPDGGMHHRSAIAFRDTLRDEKNKDLREDYGSLKWKLVANDEFTDIWQYAEQKNEIVRKVLQRAGWSEEELDKKDAMREKHWPAEFEI